MLNKFTRGFGLILCFLIVSSVFYLFTFNSGYGYDALEYLVIGRSLLDGYPFYTFVPSKSLGLYYFVASFLLLGNVSNHYSISLLITLIFSSTLLFTFFIVRRKFNDRVALISSLLVGICGVFMDLNFLEPEGLVYIFGLLGFYCISNAVKRQRNRGLFIGGLWIGAGCSFKAVAGFYWLASAIFIFFWEYFIAHNKISDIIKKELIIFCGLSITIIMPIGYFALSGGLWEHLEWTYFFPLFKYPSHLHWFYKLYTKLLWFFILVPTVFIYSLRANLRKKIYSSPNNIFIMVLGFIFLIPLFKTQAPHYVYPGAAFLSIFSAVVIDEETKRRGARFSIRIPAFALLLIFFVCAISIYLYYPSAIKRLHSFSDYSYETYLKASIQKYVPSGKKVLYFRCDPFLYWISERYPNFPLVYLSVQGAYVLEKNPELLLRALGDPNLCLVEFNPELIDFIDSDFLKKKQNTLLLETFSKILNKRFVISDINFKPYVFWIRRDLLNK